MTHPQAVFVAQNSSAADSQSAINVETRIMNYTLSISVDTTNNASYVHIVCWRRHYINNSEDKQDKEIKQLKLDDWT